MKVLHVPFCYYPDAVGGTEVYVASLARVQQARGYEVSIAAPGAESQTYSHEGFDIHRFGISENVGLRMIYGEGDPLAAANFLKVIERTRPDVLHLHALTSGISVLVADEARRKGIPIVFTYHTPTVTCTRGTMMRWGRESCDGEMRVSRCAACLLHSKGVSPIGSWALGNLPRAAGKLAGDAGLSGGFWTAFRATELVGLRHAATRRLLLTQANHIFAVCEWVKKVLLANGVSPDRVSLSRQGVPHSIAAGWVPERKSTPVRFAFLGRLELMKGVDILIDAFRAVPDLAATLDIFAVIQDDQARERRSNLIEKSQGDTRIRFQAPLAADAVVNCLRSYDALLVPSQWLETGPLVVYEAFAAGIPVVGTALGGIAELVRDGENGILVPPASIPSSSIPAWSAAISRLVENPDFLRKLKDSPKPVRTAEDSADDAGEVYARLVAGERG
jgi:glycosyltransferase involved in cell wall biosynthesis